MMIREIITGRQQRVRWCPLYKGKLLASWLALSRC